MNPIKEVYKIIKFGILDLKDDIKWIFIIIKRVMKGESLVKDGKKEDMKNILKNMSPSKIIKEDWHWLLAILFALVIGWLLTSKYYEMQCNNFIIETYVKPQLEQQANNLSNYINYNFS